MFFLFSPFDVNTLLRALGTNGPSTPQQPKPNIDDDASQQLHPPTQAVESYSDEPHTAVSAPNQGSIADGSK